MLSILGAVVLLINPELLLAQSKAGLNATVVPVADEQFLVRFRSDVVIRRAAKLIPDKSSSSSKLSSKEISEQISNVEQASLVAFGLKGKKQGVIATDSIYLASKANKNSKVSIDRLAKDAWSLGAVIAPNSAILALAPDSPLHAYKSYFVKQGDSVKALSDRGPDEDGIKGRSVVAVIGSGLNESSAAVTKRIYRKFSCKPNIPGCSFVYKEPNTIDSKRYDPSEEVGIIPVESGSDSLILPVKILDASGRGSLLSLAQALDWIINLKNQKGVLIQEAILDLDVPVVDSETKYLYPIFYPIFKAAEEAGIVLAVRGASGTDVFTFPSDLSSSSTFLNPKTKKVYPGLNNIVPLPSASKTGGSGGAASTPVASSPNR